MTKRTKKTKATSASEPVAKKPHIEKEDSFAESCVKFKQARVCEDGLLATLSKFTDLAEKLPASDVKVTANTELGAVRAFHPIVHATLIHLTSHADEPLESLEDILTSWTKCDMSPPTAKDSKSKGKVTSEDEEPAWADVAMDAIISMLPSCNNKCLRYFLQGAKRIVNHTTENVIESITVPLTGVEDELSDSEGEEEDEESNESASDDDVEGVNDASDGEEEEEEEEEEEVEEEEQEEESKELEKLKAKLHGILYQTKSANRSAEESAEGDASEDELDDESMFALDEAICEAFKEKLASKKSVLDAKEETFKCRMLKLIQCYTCHQERKDKILIPLTLSLLPLMKVTGGELKARLIETLGRLFDIKIRKMPVKLPSDLLDTLRHILNHLIEQAGIAKTADESTLIAKGINWVLKMHQPPLSAVDGVTACTLTSSAFVSLSHICPRSTGLQLVQLLVPHLESSDQLKPLQLAHAYEIISHVLAKFTHNNGHDELPVNTCKQVFTLAKDKATQLTSQMNDGKCNWLLLSSVIQTLNYVKVIFTKNCQEFTLDATVLQSLTSISGKNRKKMPKGGQSAIKGLLSSSKKGKKSGKNKPLAEKAAENRAEEDASKAVLKKEVKKSKIPLPKGKSIKGIA